MVESAAILDNTDQEIIEGIQVEDRQAFEDMPQLSQLSYSETHAHGAGVHPTQDELSVEFPREQQDFQGLGEVLD